MMIMLGPVLFDQLALETLRLTFLSGKNEQIVVLPKLHLVTPRSMHKETSLEMSYIQILRSLVLSRPQH